MTKIKPRQYAQALYEILQGTEEREWPGLIRNFVSLLARQSGLGRADKIIAAFHDYYNERAGVVELTVCSARPLRAADRRVLQTSLESKLECPVELKERLDPSLLGGVVFRYGDRVIEGSARRRINDLAATLSR